MITVTFVQPDGRRRQVPVRVGQSLMRAAVEGNIEGIQADCGGCLSCATCHVYLDTPGHVAPPDADELGMLDAVNGHRRANSRLSCQVLMAPGLDGAVIVVPGRD